MPNQTQPSIDGGSDQRYLPRWEISNRVYFYLDHDARTYQGTTKDLSACGTCITTEPILPLRDKIKLTVFLSPHTSFEVDGRIMWSKTVDGEMQLGVLFETATQKIQELILRHAFEIQKNKVVDQWFKGWN